MKKQIYTVISELFEIDISQVNDSFSMDTFSNWDSIMHIMLIAELEDKFSITFEPDEIARINSLELLLEHLRLKVKR